MLKISAYCLAIGYTKQAFFRVQPFLNGKISSLLAEFLDGVDPRRGKPATAEFAASTLVEGLLQEKFLISSQVGYEEQIVEFARAGLDPRALIVDGGV